jgi:peptidoglycan/xylan/chitin deacetylase (PgdA/CDA1 family)
LHESVLGSDLSAKYPELQQILDVDMLSWEELRELSSDPLITVGAHTVTHPVLSCISETEVRAELTQCREILRERLGVPIDFLAYPFGGAGEVSEREHRLAQELGYECAVTVSRRNFRSRGENIYALPRIPVLGSDSALDLEMKLLGLFRLAC